MKVVNTAIELAKKAEFLSQPFDSVWAVFDKDNFADFNAAIEKAENNNINVAWSNEAFELWYLYHFHNRTTRMSRNDYKKAISDAVNATGKWPKKQPYEYKKEDENNYNIMNTYGNIRNAIKWAKQQHQTFADKNYANQNPCTTVYKLALQLLNEDKDLIAFHKEMIRIHKKYKVFKTGSVHMLGWKKDVLAYSRFNDTTQIVVVINNSDELKQVTLPVWKAEVPMESMMRRLIYSYEDGFTTEHEEYIVKNGETVVNMGPHSALVLKRM